MSFYLLAIYVWSAVAVLGLVASLVAFTVELAARAISRWLSSFDEPVISSHRGPLSVL
jgi:hypothetical protein